MKLLELKFILKINLFMVNVVIECNKSKDISKSKFQKDSPSDRSPQYISFFLILFLLLSLDLLHLIMVEMTTETSCPIKSLLFY